VEDLDQLVNVLGLLLLEELLDSCGPLRHDVDVEMEAGDHGGLMLVPILT
jgi:hypothetical protein